MFSADGFWLLLLAPYHDLFFHSLRERNITHMPSREREEEGTKSLIIKVRPRYLLLSREHKIFLFVSFSWKQFFKDFYLRLGGEFMCNRSEFFFRSFSFRQTMKMHAAKTLCNLVFLLNYKPQNLIISRNTLQVRFMWNLFWMCLDFSKHSRKSQNTRRKSFQRN